MKAVVCRAGELSVAEIPAPRPGPGQVMLNVARAGICGSDLHARVHGDYLAEMAAQVGYLDAPRSDDEVVGYGPGTHRRWKPGTLVVSMPMRRDAARCESGRTCLAGHLRIRRSSTASSLARWRRAHSAELGKELVRDTGIEPVTSTVSR
ncbi:alcohol dehydrogenase catalytic domain-containing protein [Saccharopolyspora antimicrobica]|uniref:alcohol dehydrogenase catalytic domain-containing protein n=1 Tax=Saccharopolyspora antimicrobica TaxID=455193 RepID=UPI000EB604F5